MKIINIIAFCILLATPFYASEKKKMNKKEQLKAAEKAYLKEGEEAAKQDFKNGIYQIKVYGMIPPDKYYYDYLKEKFNISRKGVAGCMITSKIIKNVAGYNKVMIDLLNKKFKRDIFLEARNYAKEQRVKSNLGNRDKILKDKQHQVVKKMLKDKQKEESK